MTSDFKIQVLMLEDSDTDAELVTNVLERSGIEMEIYREEKRESFLQAVKTIEPDIILSDYNLKGYNGLNAYKDMKNEGHNVPFILVTGSLPDEVAVECLQTGIDDYIIKDRLSRLPDAITGVLTKWQNDEERINAVNQLVKSQKRLAEAEQLARVGNWEWDLKSNTVEWSAQMFRIFELEPNEYTPDYNSYLSFIYPADKEIVLRETQKLIKGEINTIDLTFMIRTAKSRRKVIHAIYKTGNTENEAGKIFCTMQNVTKLHKTERALRELNEQLEDKVKERTSELQKTNILLNHTNREITDSINYAKRIQRAILSKSEDCKKIFPNSFVLWKPKSIVSGDFYWCYSNDDYGFIAVADCTGHGVPGALMSIIANQMLDRVVNTYGFLEPKDILSHIDEAITTSLNQENESVRDGLDIILCRVDKKKRLLSFAGALRPLFYFNGEKLDEIPGNKHAIGGAYAKNEAKQFTQHEITYKEGDCIFLTSDGYHSQFNYHTGKKMMKVRMMRVLESVGKKEPRDQQHILSRYFDSWKGHEEQVDDVLIIGVKF